MEERWVKIPKYEGIYEISSYGRIKSCRRIVKREHGNYVIHESILSPGNRGKGYLGVTLCDGVAKVSAYVHRLVMLSFIGECPENQEVMHLDGNKKNNILANLRYGSRSCNFAFKIDDGTATVGENHPMSKLTAEDVTKLRHIRRISGESYAILAAMFKISPMSAYRAINKQSWG